MLQVCSTTLPAALTVTLLLPVTVEAGMVMQPLVVLKLTWPPLTLSVVMLLLLLTASLLAPPLTALMTVSGWPSGPR